MRQFIVLFIVLYTSLLGTGVRAQAPANLVTSHQTQIVESDYTQIDFTMATVPEAAVVSFEVRFEPRFV